MGRRELNGQVVPDDLPMFASPGDDIAVWSRLTERKGDE